MELELKGVGEVNGGLVEREVFEVGPEVEDVAGGAAAVEAAVDVFGEVHGEGIWRVAERAVAAALGSVATAALGEGVEVRQHGFEGDLLS